MTYYILRVIDFETTGIPSEGNPQSVIEAASVDIEIPSKEIGYCYETLVYTDSEIDLESRAVHHIDPRDLVGQPSWDQVEANLTLCKDDEEIIYVAHNADFEKYFFNPDGARWIDTYKVALKLYPDAPRHTNQVLKYYLGIEDKPEHHPPHRALPDCLVTAEILLKMNESTAYNEMIKISKEPPYLTKIGFGKHRGEKFEDLPQDYLQWLSKQADMDEGVKAAVSRNLR